jgi:uncharacterized protein (DUF983 family)
MPLISSLHWLFKCVFTCNHARTTAKEGKCFCPDCGRGVIFQWVVMRCESCRQRTESRLLLRQLVPQTRCCATCGQASFYYDYLEAPSYFQLHQARLIIREEADVLQGRYRWSVFSVAEHWSEQVEASLRQRLKRLTGQTLAYFQPLRQTEPIMIEAHCERMESA